MFLSGILSTFKKFCLTLFSNMMDVFILLVYIFSVIFHKVFFLTQKIMKTFKMQNTTLKAKYIPGNFCFHPYVRSWVLLFPYKSAYVSCDM